MPHCDDVNTLSNVTPVVPLWLDDDDVLDSLLSLLCELWLDWLLVDDDDVLLLELVDCDDVLLEDVLDELELDTDEDDVLLALETDDDDVLLDELWLLDDWLDTLELLDELWLDTLLLDVDDSLLLLD